MNHRKWFRSFHKIALGVTLLSVSGTTVTHAAGGDVLVVEESGHALLGLLKRAIYFGAGFFVDRWTTKPTIESLRADVAMLKRHLSSSRKKTIVVVIIGAGVIGYLISRIYALKAELAAAGGGDCALAQELKALEYQVARIAAQANAENGENGATTQRPDVNADNAEQVRQMTARLANAAVQIQENRNRLAEQNQQNTNNLIQARADLENTTADLNLVIGVLNQLQTNPSGKISALLGRKTFNNGELDTSISGSVALVNSMNFQLRAFHAFGESPCEFGKSDDDLEHPGFSHMAGTTDENQNVARNYRKIQEDLLAFVALAECAQDTLFSAGSGENNNVNELFKGGSDSPKTPKSLAKNGRVDVTNLIEMLKGFIPAILTKSLDTSRALSQSIDNLTDQNGKLIAIISRLSEALNKNGQGINRICVHVLGNSSNIEAEVSLPSQDDASNVIAAFNGKSFIIPENTFTQVVNGIKSLMDRLNFTQQLLFTYNNGAQCIYGVLFNNEEQQNPFQQIAEFLSAVREKPLALPNENGSDSTSTTLVPKNSALSLDNTNQLSLNTDIVGEIEIGFAAMKKAIEELLTAKNSVTKLQQQLDVLQDQKTQAEANLRKEKDDLSAQLTTSQSSLSVSQTKNTELDTRIQELNREIARLKKEIDEQKSNIAVKTQYITKINTTVEALKKKLRELCGYQAESLLKNLGI